MSEHRPDDPRLEDGLREALSGRAGEQPRAEIDARILAAAHRAIDSRPRPAGTRRWFPRIDTPLATAAVVMVSAALLVLMREQGHFDGAMTSVIKEQAQPAGTPLPAAGAPITAGRVSAESQSIDAPPARPAAAEAASADVRMDATAAKIEAAAASSAAPAAAATAAPLPPEETLGASAGLDAAKKRSADDAGTSVTSAAAEASMRKEVPAAAPAAPPPAQPFPGGTPEAEIDASGAVSDKSVLQVDKARHAAPMESTAPTAELKEDASATISAPLTSPPAQPEAAVPMMNQAPAAGAEATSPAGGSTFDDRRRMQLRDDEATATDVEREKPKASTPPPTEQEQALKGIRDLIAAGRYSDARLALARFAKAYPDYRLPADIIAALKPAD